MTDEITTGELAKLFDTTPKTIADLGKRGIIEKGSKRGTWALDASVTGYVKHLRAEAAARGGEEAAQARARLGQAQPL
jgi:phage terminase Nu1 subunit (DNA packaging protein)